MEKRKLKQKIGQLPQTTAWYKKAFISKLEKGFSPRKSALLVKIAHTTAYGWRHTDSEFAAKWDEAILTTADLVESALVQRALKFSDGNAQFYLRAHKPEIYGKHETSTRVTVRMTMEESHERLRQLGVPLPIIEGDCADEDITVPQAIEGDRIDE